MYIISIIYGAHWKSHECPSRDLSISALERYLCDENRLAPTIVWSLHAFLTLVHKSRPSTSFIYQHLCALYETPGCTYRLIHVVEGLVCLNKCSVLWQHLSKNLQSLGRKKNLSKIMECQNIEWSSTRRELANILQQSKYLQDWPQKIMESETGQIFQASAPKTQDEGLHDLEIHRNDRNWRCFSK